MTRGNQWNPTICLLAAEPAPLKLNPELISTACSSSDLTPAQRATTPRFGSDFTTSKTSFKIACTWTRSKGWFLRSTSNHVTIGYSFSGYDWSPQQSIKMWNFHPSIFYKHIFWAGWSELTLGERRDPLSRMPVHLQKQTCNPCILSLLYIDEATLGVAWSR